MSKRNRNRNRDQQKKHDGSSASGGPEHEHEGPESDEGEGEAEASAAADAPPAEAAASEPAPVEAVAPAVVDAAGPATAAVAVDLIPMTPAPAPAPVAAKPRAVSNDALHPVIAPLVERLRAGRCVLWAGSGLDEAAGGVGFRGLVERLLQQLPPSAEVDEARELLPRRPFLVAGFVKRRLGSGFAAALQAAAKSPAHLPAELAALGELPFRAVLTTGFSDLLARAFTRDGQTPPVYTANTVARREGRGRYLLKALGDPGDPGGVVFAAGDFQRLLGEEGLASAVRDFYRNRTILFLGVDPPVDVDRLFVRLLQGTPLDGVEHYAVLPGLTRLEREELETSYRLKIIDEADVLAVIRALRAAVGDVTEALPDDDDLEGWLGLLTAEPDRADAAAKIKRLEEKLLAAGDHERLLELHLGMVEIENSHATRAYRLHQVARLFEKNFGDPGRAFTALLAAYKEDPEHEVADDLERLAEVTRSWSDLLAEYVQVAPSLSTAIRGKHWTRVARLYAEKLNQTDYALHALDEALKVDSASRDALELRLSVLRRAEKWKELPDAIAVIAATEESLGRRSELHLEQGDVLETRLNDVEGAVKAYRAALEADPGSNDALHALELVHRRRGDWKDLVAVLDQKVKSLSGERAVELRLEVAGLVAEKLGAKKDAIARYEALRADEENLAALRALEKLYEAEGDTDAYLRTLAAQAERVKETGERIALYRRLAVEWEERPNGRSHAAGWYEKITLADGKSEDAFRALERIYQAEGRVNELVDTYRRHQDVPGADKVALMAAAAGVIETELKDAARAEEAWSAVLKAQPGHEAALAALTRLYERAGHWDKALGLLDQRIEAAKDKEQKAELLTASGKIAAERLGDPKKAEERLHRALELDHDYVPALVAMVDLYRKSGELLRAAKLLVEAASHTTNRLDKTRMLVEAGEIYDGLEQHHIATDLLLQALAVDPEHVDAGGRVADLLWKAERWAELVPVLEMLTRKEADRATMKQRYLRLGRAAKSLGQQDKAGRAYIKAGELDPTDVEAARACGEIFFAESKWAEAREAFKAVLGHGGDDIGDTERVSLYYRLGECDKNLGAIDKAKNFYAKALEIDPTHRPTLFARLSLDANDPAKIIEAKRALLATASDDEKVKLLTEIGDLYLDKLGDGDSAVAAWKEAVAIKPDARQLLHKSLDVFVEKKDWKQALDALAQLTEAEKVPTIRAKFKYARAMVYLDELTDPQNAIKLLGEAIDDDPGAVKMAQKLEDLLIQTESWKELQRYYRKLIKRMAPEAESDSAETKKERLRVWSALADVSIEKLGEIGVGLPALEVATTLEPANGKRKEQLADLLVEAGADYADKAIAAQQTLLKVQRDRIASYRALRRLYAETKQGEKALACAYALSFLRKGAAEDEPLVAQLKQRPMQPARRNLDDDLWQRCLMHADEDKVLSSFFALVLPTLMAANSVPHKDVPLQKKDKVEDTDPRGFAKGVRYVSNALNVKLPHEVYVKYEQREALASANCLQDTKPLPTPVACLVVGQPLLGDKRSERELVFELTKRLAYFRSDRYLRFVIGQAAQLGLLVDSAVTLASEGEKGGSAETVKIAAEWKRALPAKTLEQIVAIGKKYKGQKGEQLATQWLAATDLTATRAAFLLVGDLETTARFVAAEPATISSLPPIQRLKELIHFSVTEECFTLKKHMQLMT